MPLTQNVEIGRFVDQELRAYRLLAGARIFKGALVGVQRASGFARSLQLGDAFAGIAYEEVDNTGGQNGERAIRVFSQGDFRLPVGGALQSALGRPVFANADDILTLSPAAGATMVGICLDVLEPGMAIVRIAPFADLQNVRYAATPLASSTSVFTSNPVLIAAKPLVVLAAEVVFNTKPDQGALDVGVGNSTPNEIVNGFNLTTLTNHVRTPLTIVGAAVAKDARVWARVGQANATPGAGGLLMLRYIEVP